MAKKPPANSSTSEMLRSFRDRIVRLEEEKKALSDDIKDVYQEAKSAGFDMKALRRVVKDSRMDQTQRAAVRETESIVDLYRASLGMLDGTPLGDAARRRFDEEQPPRRAESGEAPEGGSESDAEAEPEPTPDDQALEDEAREQGRSDHAAGKSILQNPFAGSDFRRAAWDEGWCQASGSDGMDLPDAWRRRDPAGDSAPEERAP